MVEQIIRPTGLVDPPVDVRPIRGQVDDLLGEIRKRVERNERVLITTLTKRMSEDLQEYYAELGVRCSYMHSEVSTLDRVKILRDLRRGEIDVLIGVNLLREGLDLPEVTLVAVLDADKEGFLRSTGSLIQTIGRAARNIHGRAILYADVMTDSMRRAIAETDRRRRAQVAYNEEHGITPESIVKPIDSNLIAITEADYVTPEIEEQEPELQKLTPDAAGRVSGRAGAQDARGGQELRVRKGGAVARQAQGAARAEAVQRGAGRGRRRQRVKGGAGRQSKPPGGQTARPAAHCPHQ